MRRFLAVLASVALVVTGVTTSASAAPKSFKNCDQVTAVAPYGVAKSLKASKAAQAAGFVPPQVSKSLFKRAKNLDSKKKPKGFVCGTTTQAARLANATGFFAPYDTNDLAAWPVAATHAVPGSPAAWYAAYRLRGLELDNYVNYSSKGLTVPTIAPATVSVVGDVITVTSLGAVTTLTGEFDPYGKLVSWSTDVGPLRDRLFPIQGSATDYGVTISLDWTYRANQGQVVSEGIASNSASLPLRLATANYTGPDGVVYEGYSYGGCIQPGQSIPIEAQTKAAAPAAASGQWQFQILNCSFYDYGFVDVAFGPRL